MAGENWYDFDLGDFNLGGGGDGGSSSWSAPDMGSFDSQWWNPGDFNINWNFDTQNWWDPGQFNLGNLGGFDLNFGQGGGGSSWLPQTGKDWLGLIGGAAQLGKTGFDAYNAWQRSGQLADYNKQIEDYNKALKDYDAQVAAFVQGQNDYLASRREFESGFAGAFDEAKGDFEAQNEIFQGQLADARGQAQGVLDQFMASARPFLSQAQGLMVPAVAALAKGEVPPAFQPVLNQMKQRARAAAMQSMVSAGMSPNTARSSIEPMVDQMAHEALLKQATAMAAQAGEFGKIGLTGLGGAGTMADLLGKLAQAGMDPATREFQIMAQALGAVLGSSAGGGGMPPKPPSAPVPPITLSQA